MPDRRAGGLRRRMVVAWARFPSQPASEGSLEQGQVSVGHPVDVATGKLYHDFEDFVQPGRMPIVFGRRYSSGLTGRTSGMFGEGWSSPFEMRVRETVDGYKVLHENGEHETPFYDHEGTIAVGGTLRNLANFCELRPEGERFVVTRWKHDGDEVVELVFEPDPFSSQKDWPEWRLCSRQDLEGNGIDLERDDERE